MRTKHNGIALAWMVATLLLAACGGGGNSSTPPANSPAQGLWNGATNTNRTITGIVLSNGTYYVLYSPVGSPTGIAGVTQGTGTSSAGAFSSSNGKDFNLEGLGVNSATVSASYITKQSFNGTVSYTGGGTTTFTSTYNADYETVPSLSALAGTFTGTVAFSLGVQSATITVSPTGALSGGGNGCSISGTASPRTDGNVYDILIKFGASPCYFANQSFTGIGYFNSATNTLYAVAPNAARTDGVIFVGTKP